MVSPETMEEVLQSDDIWFDEVDLFKALIEWGKAQARKDDPDCEPDYAMVKIKISPLLKFIRFREMNCKKFAEFSFADKFFSTEEKLQILACLSLNSYEKMPKEFCGASQPSRRKTPIAMDLKYLPTSGNFSVNVPIKFTVSKKVRLVGIQCQSPEQEQYGFDLYCKGEKICCTMYLVGPLFVFEDKNYFHVRSNAVLEENVEYKLRFSSIPAQSKQTCLYSLDRQTLIQSKYLTLTLTSLTTTLPVTSLAFTLEED